MIEQGPANAGFIGNCWRSPMIQWLIHEKFGVFYSVHYLSQFLIMTNYSKLFFLSMTALFGVVAAGLVFSIRDWPEAQAASVLLIAAGAAVLGRVSGTLAERFARLCGVVLAKRPVLGLLGKVTGRDLQPPATLGTSAGWIELGYECFGYEKVKKELRHIGIAVTELRLESAAFSRYLEQARYDLHHPAYYEGSPKFLAHKQVQHYASLLLAPVKSHAVWMDIASSTSPFPEILTRLYGVTVYRQDLNYRLGRQGLCIGSNATQIPVEDGLVDRVTLHCSFEHFEQDSDSRFFRELARILKPGGIACIIPLYVSDDYQILTNPRHWLSRGIPCEPSAKITASRSYWDSHGRFYDAAALKRRVLSPLDSVNLSYSLYEVQSPKEIDYPSFVALKITKPLLGGNQDD